MPFALFVKFFLFFVIFFLSASAIGIIYFCKSEVVVALKSSYTKKEDIPENLQEYYIEKDGGFHLQADGLVPKTTVDEFRNNNIKLTKELEKVQNTLNGVNVEEYKQLKEEKIQGGKLRFTIPVLFSFKRTFASNKSPVDRTFTKIFFSNSLFGANKFISFKEIVFFPNFSFGPTIISFLSELILST